MLFDLIWCIIFFSTPHNWMAFVRLNKRHVMLCYVKMDLNPYFRYLKYQFIWKSQIYSTRPNLKSRISKFHDIAKRSRVHLGAGIAPYLSSAAIPTPVPTNTKTDVRRRILLSHLASPSHQGPGRVTGSHPTPRTQNHWLIYSRHALRGRT